MHQQIYTYFLGAPINTARTVLVVLGALLVVAAWCDLYYRRIPNLLVVCGALIAVVLHAALPAGEGFLAYPPGQPGGWGGLGLGGSLAGLALGLVTLLPLYAMGCMGAGDVKLLAMLGAFLGPVHFVWTLLATLFAGGVLALGVALWRGNLRAALANLRLMLWNTLLRFGGKSAAIPAFSVVSVASLPFGVAIASGGIAYLIFRAKSAGLV